MNRTTGLYSAASILERVLSAVARVFFPVRCCQSSDFPIQTVPLIAVYRYFSSFPDSSFWLSCFLSHS